MQRSIKEMSYPSIGEFSYSAAYLQHINHPSLSPFVTAMTSLFAKDGSLDKHSNNVRLLSLQLGAAAGLRGNELQTLEISAFGHDVGKNGVPRNLLLKTGDLQEEERDALRRHTLYGQRYFSEVVEMCSNEHILRIIQTAPEIVLKSHENVDGSGYFSYRQSDIPLEAQVIRITDSYDAMRTHRPGRENGAKTHEEAVRELLKWRTTKYSAVLVDAFLEEKCWKVVY